MYMAVLAVKFLKVGFKVLADFGKNTFQVFQYLFCEYATPVFGDKDQMHMKHENTGSFSAYSVDFFHISTILTIWKSGKASNSGSSQNVRSLPK